VANTTQLIDFDRRVNFVHEKVAGEEADCAGKDEESKGHQEHVAKEQKTRDKFDDLKLSEKVQNRIQE